MSFNDLERGASPGMNGQSHLSQNSWQRSNRSSRGPLPLYHAPPSERSSTSDQRADEEERESDPEFKKLADRIGIQLFKLNANVAGLEKLVDLQDKNVQTSKGRENLDWSKQVHDLTESTRAIVKDLSTSIKALSNDFRPTSTSSTSSPLSSADRFTSSRLQRDFEVAINRFASVQKKGAQVSRDALQGAREERERKARSLAESSHAVENQAAVEERRSGGEILEAQQQVSEQQQQGPSLAEVEFQETLIAEREAEIREIEGGIHELNEIFRDLGHIVQEQGGMIDNIEYNVSSIASNTGAADRELVSAHDYQRRAGRRAACLLLIVGFVVAIVLLAILN